MCDRVHGNTNQYYISKTCSRYLLHTRRACWLWGCTGQINIISINNKNKQQKSSPQIMVLIWIALNMQYLWFVVGRFEIAVNIPFHCVMNTTIAAMSFSGQIGAYDYQRARLQSNWVVLAIQRFSASLILCVSASSCVTLDYEIAKLYQPLEIWDVAL